MAVVSLQILVAGNPAHSTGRMIFRLAERGHGAQHVDTLAEARSALGTFRFVVVLASETLPDGRGYDLARAVAVQGGHLFVGVPLSETLWLPVVERGSIVLGQRGLNASVFENEVEMALGAIRAEIGVSTSRQLNSPGPSRSAAKRRGAEAA